MTAITHVTLHCEHDECPATFTNGGRYAQEARSVAVLDAGWTVKKGRAPNAWHDFCPEHGVSADASQLGDVVTDSRLSIPDHLRHLPVFNGRPVPWVAIWSGERLGPHMLIGRYGLVPSKGERYVRREFDMWMLSGPTKREGTPDFGSTHSARQRKAMREQRCQVCGRSPSEGGGQRLWTIPDQGEHPKIWLEHLVLNPPTCEQCWQYVNRTDGPCPFVAKTTVPAFTGPAKPWGVHGTLILPSGGEQGVVVKFDHPHLPWVLGRELIMEVTDPQPYSVAS